MKKRGFQPEPDAVCFFRENEAWAVYLQDLTVRTALQLPNMKRQRQMASTASSLWAELFSPLGPLLVPHLESESLLSDPGLSL